MAIIECCQPLLDREGPGHLNEKINMLTTENERLLAKIHDQICGLV
jgi:hypothetical protein